MNFQTALEVAAATQKFLEAHCQKIDLAGSARRQCKDIVDIDMLCIPQKDISKDLLGNEVESRRSLQFVKAVNDLGKIVKGDPFIGKYIRVTLTEWLSMDLFIPDEADYYRQLAIRTGPAQYAHQVIAKTWSQNGWCGTTDGLRLKSDCIQKSVGGKVSWVCTRRNPVLPPVWESEEHFFEWLGLNWVPPVMRK